jgi:hypothetical protein
MPDKSRSERCAVKRTNRGIGVNRECSQALSVDPPFMATPEAILFQERKSVCPCIDRGAFEDKDAERRRLRTWIRCLMHPLLHPLQHCFAEQGNLPLDITSKGNELGRRERCRLALKCGDRWDWAVRNEFQ